jgi:hypothetical protein
MGWEVFLRDEKAFIPLEVWEEHEREQLAQAELELRKAQALRSPEA